MYSENEEKIVTPHVSTDTGKKHTCAFISAITDIGGITSGIIFSGASKTTAASIYAGQKITGFFMPSQHKKRSAEHAVCSVFTERRREKGFVYAVAHAVSDSVAARKQASKTSTARTIINYAVPVCSLALLVGVVYNTANASYGISVECNGKEIGVVSAESIVSEAQEKIADKAAYYATENNVIITANLSIKPLNALDEVMDEVAFADRLEEEILPEGELIPIEEENTESESILTRLKDDLDTSDSSSIDGKVKAFAITVDGKLMGAVTETNEIENFLKVTKSRYLEPDVVEVEFDKDIEYGYEQYFYPYQIVSQKSIIDKFSEVDSEPSYYEIQDGDSPWQIAIDNNMTLEELTHCFASYNGRKIDDISTYCPIGGLIQLTDEVPFLQALITKEVTYTDEIDYKIEEIEDPNIFKGEVVVDVEGTEGVAEIEALVTYKGDTPINREVLGQRIVSQPVNRRVRVGTRETTTPVSSGSGGSGDYFWPVDGGTISAYMGDGRGHKGIDICAPYGTPIYAASSGYVTRAGNKGDGYGNCVFITQDDGNTTVYGHMSSIAIENGDYVVKGQLIGYVGSTGDSTGNHLHFEVRSSGGKYIDPLEYVSQY